MSLTIILPKVIHNKDWSDHQKKTFLMKLIPVIVSNNKDMSYEDVAKNCDACLQSAIENKNSITSVNLSLLAYSLWGEKHINHLKEYLTIDKISETFLEGNVQKQIVCLLWLKYSIQLMLVDGDFIRTISPVSY